MTIYDCIIIGGGPGACTAAVYAGRKKMKTLLITESFGGQSFSSDAIENWIGEIRISGLDLAKKLEDHVRAQESVEVRTLEVGIQVQEKKEISDGVDGFEVSTDKGNYLTKTVIVATGGRRRKLSVPGASTFDNKGISYCSTCDAPLFRGKNVAVVGGGNAGLEAVVDLFPYAKQIYLLDRGTQLKGDPSTIEVIKKKVDQVKILLNADIQEIKGGSFVSQLFYKDITSGQAQTLDVQGVFVEIGSVPNSELVKDLVLLNPYGEIIIDHQTCESSKTGVFACGDVTDEKYKQNNIAAGDGVRAALSAYFYILNMQKQSPASEEV